MADAIVCPYCRMPFDADGPPKIFCTACGTPHHEDCYHENGGCTVFGCAKAPADDPKLQVSYSDLNAAMLQQPGAAVQQAAATVQQFPSPYAGPLGLNQPVPTTGGAVAAQAFAAPASPQSALAEGHVPRNRTTYIVLGVFLGMFGAHNFYAGYTGRAVGQLCLSVLTVFYLAIVSWIWAIVEICVVDRDSAGIQFS
jgi:TM2 domain-containing membrane protein YozV